MTNYIQLRKLITPSVFLGLFIFFLTACDSKKFETCGGQPTCPPFDEKAAPDIQKLRESLAGKWKLMTITAKDTFHKTEKTYNTQRFGLCISYNGGILLHKDYKDVVCTYCYELNKVGDKNFLNLDGAAANTFCAEALQSSEINVMGDSVVLFRLDSFITKRIVYRRANDDWSLKLN